MNRMPATIEPLGDAIRRLYLEINPPKEPTATPRRAATPVSQSDSDLLAVMFAAKNGHKIKALWDGDSTGYASASEGDYALVSHLAFYAQGDERRIDSLFKQSGRYTEERAEKWDRLGPDTIKKVVAGTSEFYTPPMRMDRLTGFERNGTAKPNESDPPPVPEVEPETPPSAFMRTDTGNGEWFAYLFRNSVRYDHKRGRYLIWREHWWCEDLEEEVQQFAKAALRIRGKAAWDIEDDARRKDELSWVAKSEARPRREAMIWAARSELPISDAGESWDADPWLIGVGNGVVDLRTGELRPGKREDRITNHIDLDFDKDAPAERWIRFLEEIFGDSELIRFIQRAVGYTLTGETSEQVLFLGHGEGSNGKSIFLEALRDAFGPYAYSAAFSTLDTSSRNKVPQDIANLMGRRFVTAIETNEGVSLNEGRVKALTGGDPITARFLFQNEFTFKPVAKFWLAVNHKPRIGDDSYGFWRRICLLPFLRQFKGEAVDKKLGEKLKAEAPGILAWAVKGTLLWQQEGLKPPDILLSATEDYQQESDALAGFLGEACILSPTFKAKAGEMFKAYQKWCDDQGMNPRERLTSRTFGERLNRRFSKKKEPKGLHYLGIGLSVNLLEEPTSLDFEREDEKEMQGCIVEQAESATLHHERDITKVMQNPRLTMQPCISEEEIEEEKKREIEEEKEGENTTDRLLSTDVNEDYLRGEL